MYKILVSDAMNQEGLEPLLTNTQFTVIQSEVNQVEGELHTFDGLLVRSSTQVSYELLKKMYNLKIIARAGVGIDNIDLKAATMLGIVVINAPDGNTISTAEHTFAMMLSLIRQIPQANNSLKDNQWNRKDFVGTELYNKSLGIIGLGRVGSEIAKLARAFSMNIFVFDPYLSFSKAEKLGVTSCSLDALLNESDIITIHTPLTSDTKGLLGKDNLSKTKKGVYLINCARGGIIDEIELIQYLENEHIAGVALDVFENEPPTNHPLLQYQQVITTPHLGASTKEAQLNVATQVSFDLVQFFNGKPISSSINLPTLPSAYLDTLKPFHSLSRKLGYLISRFYKKPVLDITVTYSGKLAETDNTYITQAILAGFLTTRIDTTVNEVNASLIAKEHGITIGTKLSTNTFGYTSCITISIHSDKGDFFELRGTYVKDFGERIVNINGYNVDFSPEGNMLFIQHNDRPGVIGKVGKILGDNQINIATMHVGRKQAGGDAIMFISFDQPLTQETVHLIKQIDDVLTAVQIDF
ncbi:phosphoglycerate dehydrogenase [Bacillus timonensis]|nr:phosphoglycerate dehydrogenase [Bacillus timonensis]